MSQDNQVYAVEHNGDMWQSVFPVVYAEYSSLHESIIDGIEYIWSMFPEVDIVVISDNKDPHG